MLARNIFFIVIFFSIESFASNFFLDPELITGKSPCSYALRKDFEDYIMGAVKENNLSVIVGHLNTGGSLLVRDSYGKSILHHAAEAGSFNVANYICNYILVNKCEKELRKYCDLPDNSGKSAIHYAIKNKHENIVAILVKFGAKVSRENFVGMDKDSLIYNMALYCLQKNGRYLLHYAVAEDDSDMVEFLLDTGLSIRERDSKRSAPLHCVTPNTSTETSSLLNNEVNKRFFSPVYNQKNSEITF